MRSALLHKRAFTGYPNEVELLEAGGDRLFEVDSLRQPGQRMLVALAEDGTADYPVYDPDKKKVKWKLDDRFGKKFKAEVKKHMQAEVEKAETPKEEQEAVNSPALRQAAGLHEARLTYQCPFCQGHDAKPIGQTQDQTIYRCQDCGRKFPMSEQVDVQEHVFASDQWNETPKLDTDVVGPLETTSLSQWASKNAAIPESPQWEIISTPDGSYRYVNHDEKLLTTGFGSEEGLRRNADIIRMDAGTLDLMRKRYAKEFGAQPTTASQKVAATVHDLKPLIDRIRRADNHRYEGGRLVLDKPTKASLTEELIALSKEVGAGGLRQAARHYLQTLKNADDRRSMLGQVPRRTERAIEDAWKRVEAEFVHYVR